MDIHVQYEILYFDPVTGTVSVRYYCEDNPEGLVYAIDVPIVDEQYASEEELIQLIELMKPTGQLHRITVAKLVEIPQYLQDLIPPPIEEPVIEEPTDPVV
jgi:hypothetical protein